MACYDYNDRDGLTPTNVVVEQAGKIFSYAFTAECMIKIISMGFIVHPKAYLRDGWNWIDFIVVVVG
jgi:hypothetical protein